MSMELQMEQVVDAILQDYGQQRHIDKLESFCHKHKVLMGIITVPGEYAQEVADQLIAGGIKAIWNFAPTHLDVPPNILVQNENMATSLAVLSMHLQAQMKEEKESAK